MDFRAHCSGRSRRQGRFLIKQAFALALLAAACSVVVTDAQQAGHNTPVLPGRPANDNDPQAHLKSDLLEQGQVEASGVVSTRDPSNMIWAFNDYRAVDIAESSAPGGSEISEYRPGAVKRFFAWATGRPLKQSPAVHVRAASEASVGLSFSYDGGQTFTGALLKPIEGLAAMTDPRFAAAPCGKAYLVVLAFTRDGRSVIAVVKYEDLALPTGDSWQNQGYTIIDDASNSPGAFHDKPWIVVDPARPTGGKVSDPCAHNVYVGWARFNGEGQSVKLNFARSSNGKGYTKSFITSPAKTVQGVVIDVDKRPGTPKAGGGGTIYYGFRSFRTPTSNDQPTMYVVTSTDFGATFGKAVAINTTPTYPFDQPSIGTDFDATGVKLAFRTNAFLTIQSVPIGPNKSRLFAAWAERRVAPCGAANANGDPKIVYTWSDNGGQTWSPRQLLDCFNRDNVSSNLPKAGLGFLPQPRGPGGQFQVHFTSGGGRFGALYHESRDALTVVGAETFITRGSPTATHRGNHIDARFVLINPGTSSTAPAFAGTNQVSRYPIKFGADLTDNEGIDDVFEVAPGVKAVNDRSTEPTRVTGTTPFFGDYPDAIPVVSLVPVRDSSGNVTGWKWAINSTDVPFQGFHVGFSDSRNQIPTALNQYPNYHPPSCPSCSPPIIYPPTGASCPTAGTRNLDIVHALVNASVAVNAASTFESPSLIARNFPVTITNGTDVMKFYRAFFSDFTAGATASFSQDTAVPEVLVELFPYSSTTRTVTLRGQDQKASVRVNVLEIELSGCAPGQPPRLDTCTSHSDVSGGQTGSTVLNLDPTTPLQASNNETQIPGTKGPGTKGIALTPGTKGPGTKGSALNPGTKGDSIANMLIENPALDEALDAGKKVYKIIDVTWDATNGGTDAATLFSQFNIEKPAVLDQNYVFHLLISRQSAFASLDPTTCSTQNGYLDQVISSIPMSPLSNNPLINNPGTKGDALNPGTKGGVITNATFAVAPSAGSGTSSARASATADPSAAPIVPGWGDIRDSYKDVAFVTLRAFQLAPDDQIPLAAQFRPGVNPPALTLSSLIKDTINGVVQPDVNSVSVSPDLVIASGTPAVSPNSARPGGQVTFPAGGWTLQNAGTASANAVDGAFTHGYYLSTDDNAIEATDTFLGSVTTTGPLAAGASQAFPEATLTIPADVPPGTYVIGILVDSDGEVSESSETNNTASVPITVLRDVIDFQDQPVGSYAGGTVTICCLARSAPSGSPAGGVDVTFTGAGLLIRDLGSQFPAGASRVLSTAPSDLQPITATLGGGVTTNFVQIHNWINGRYTGEVDTIKMTAYDAAGNEIASVTSSNEFISISSPDIGIAKVTFDDVPVNGNDGYVLDEFQIVPPPVIGAIFEDHGPRDGEARGLSIAPQAPPGPVDRWPVWGVKD